MRVTLLIYLVGVALGVAFTDARPLTRVAIALAWPIGPAAFVLVVSLLLVAALYLFPVFGAVAAAGAGLAGWMFFR